MHCGYLILVCFLGAELVFAAPVDVDDNGFLSELHLLNESLGNIKNAFIAEGFSEHSCTEHVLHLHQIDASSIAVKLSKLGDCADGLRFQNVNNQTNQTICHAFEHNQNLLVFLGQEQETGTRDCPPWTQQSDSEYESTTRQLECLQCWIEQVEALLHK